MKKRLLLAVLSLLVMAAVPAWADTVVLTEETRDVTLNDGDVLTGTGGPYTHVMIADRAEVTFEDVTITDMEADTPEQARAAITCLGDAYITLRGFNMLEGASGEFGGQNPAIFVPEGFFLEIFGNGDLEVSCGRDHEGNMFAPAIGGTGNANCGYINIDASDVRATGGCGCAAIGSADTTSCDGVSIWRGNIVAYGGEDAAAIGSGLGGHIEEIYISEHVESVEAYSGANAPYSIGPGKYGTYGIIIIGGRECSPREEAHFVYPAGLPLSVGSSTYGTVEFYIDDMIARKAPEGTEVTIRITPRNTHATQSVSVQTFMDMSGAQAPRRAPEVQKDVALTRVDNNTYTFTMPAHEIVATVTYVEKTNAVITLLPTAKTGLIWNGDLQELIVAGEAEGGELQYSLDGENYSTDIPQASATGFHTVYYRVAGDDFHFDLDAETLEASIKADTHLLESLIADAEDYWDSISDDYPDIADALKLYIRKANDVIDNVESTQQEVNDAYDQLENALNEAKAAKAEADLKRVSVTVAAKSFVTMYQAENRTAETPIDDIKFYTIESVNDSEVMLSGVLDVVRKETPFLIYNASDEPITFDIVATNQAPDDEYCDYEHFKGTLTQKTFTDEEWEEHEYYVLDGQNFVWVKDQGTIAANRCWLQIEPQAGARQQTLRIKFHDDGVVTSIHTTDNASSPAVESWYDLSGRRIAGKPTQKGMFIQNGKKVVVK